MARAVNRAAVTSGIFRQTRRGGLFSPTLMISTSIRLRNFAVFAGLTLVAAVSTFGQTNYYTTNGSEYTVIGSLPGEQMFPDVALSTNGGFLVWQDNATDGDGWGVSACRLDNTLSGMSDPFRVNVVGTNDQENARVALLNNGGAVFVWQGGKPGSQHIMARFLAANNTWLKATDLAVSSFNSSFQVNPAVATLNNGNVVVVWVSFNQAGTNSLMDVYAKILSPTGSVVKNEFLVNQFTAFNQRSPSVTALKNGGFAVAWISEQQRAASSTTINQTSGTDSTQISLPSVDVYVRLFQASGTATGNEFIANTGINPCANSAIAAAANGSFMVSWSGRDMLTRSNGWDVYARSFSTNGVGGGVTLVNTHLAGNQYAPRLSALGLDYMVAWTSLSQDGSREGVYGRFLHNDGTPTSDEFRVNTTTVSQQMQPVVASDGSSQFVAIWTSYAGSPYSFDLFAQRYVNVNSVLQAMSPPFVYVPFTLTNNVYQPQVQVSWAPLPGISVSNFEVYVDGVKAAATTNNTWIMTAANGLTTNSTHTFQLDYVKPGGDRPPLSGGTTVTTWTGANWGGVPYEWMLQYYGNNLDQWPQVGTTLQPGGLTLPKIFISGGNPLDSSTWLTTQLLNTKQGMFLTWNTQPGRIYQVQFSTNFVTWSNLGLPRFAAGVNDSINVGGNTAGYYRMLLVR